MSGSAPEPFSVELVQRDGSVAVVASGELDLATAAEFEAALLPVVEAGGEVVLDLRALEFMDSSGVRVVITAHMAAVERGGRLTVLRGGPRSPVGRVLEVSGLDDVLDLAD